MTMLTLLCIVLALALLATTLLVVRQHHDFKESFDGLPTGLCAVGSDNRVLRWNQQMVHLSGIPALGALGQSISALPNPWPDALGQVLNETQGKVLKQSLGEDERGRPRWVILHSSDLPKAGRYRQVLIEEISDYEQLQDELLHRERLASIGRLAAGVAHEIGNPVTGIACVAQNLAHSRDPAEMEQAASEILKLTERISRTVTSLMQLSHPGSIAQDAHCVPCNLADCVDEAIHLLELDLEAEDGGFTNLCDRELLVLADAQLLLQVFLNLLDNARSAAAGEGPVTVAAKVDGERVSIVIDNPGEPIAAMALSQVFEPFFTTKDVGEGTGLGLPLVRRMLEDMDGSINLQSPAPNLDGRGARAELNLSAARYQQPYET